MNVPLCIVLVAEIMSIITETEAGPRWKWGAKSNYNGWNWHHSETGHGCSVGQCVKAWKCPIASISEESTGSCSYWNNGPWVCCVVDNFDNSHRREDTNRSWKRNVRTTTVDYNYDKGRQPRVEDPWNRNAKEVYNKRTSLVNSITTDSWKKTRTPGSRIIFPTESISIQKVTRYPTFNPKTASYSQSTAKSWTRSTRTSSTKLPWGYTTGRAVSKTTRFPYSGKPTASTRATTSQERRNQGWGSTAAIHPVRGQTKRPMNTNKPISTRSTTRSTRRYQVTTPLPNVNIHMCGIRDQRSVTHRRARNNNYWSNPVAGAVRPGRQPYQRIVGGEEAEPFSWPWVAALYKVTSSGGHRFLSAGSLINGHFVLTAAHVFTPDDIRSASYVVMLGTHDAQDAVAEYVVSSVVQHPRYEHRYYYYDIALLELESPVIFNDYVMPVCLPSPNAPLLSDRDLRGKMVTVMGWGDDSFGGKSSRVLKQATFPIVSRVSCNASYVRVASNRFPKGITNDMLCAGDPNGGKDACQGDSGGPLTSIENRRYTQVGIVSFGYKCGDKEFPGVYTKIAPYLSWIAENTRSSDHHMDYDYY